MTGILVDIPSQGNAITIHSSGVNVHMMQYARRNSFSNQSLRGASQMLFIVSEHNKILTAEGMRSSSFRVFEKSDEVNCFLGA